MVGIVIATALSFAEVNKPDSHGMTSVGFLISTSIVIPMAVHVSLCAFISGRKLVQLGA